MTLPAAVLLAVLRRGARGQVAPGFLAPQFTVSRAHSAGAEATSIGPDSTTLRTHAPNTARFNGPGQHLLVEEERTNVNANPRAEGGTPGVIGSGGVYPTSSGYAGGVNGGLTVEIISSGGALVAMRQFGTATGAISNPVFMPGVAFVLSEVWTSTIWAQLLGGPLPWNSNHHLFEAFVTPITIDGTLRRFVQTAPAVGTTNRRGSIRHTLTVSQAYDFTTQFGRVQLERGAHASSLILPPAGTPGASTRFAESVSATLASLGIAAGARCTIQWVGAFAATANPHPNPQTLFCLSDGTANNLVEVYVPPGSAQITVNTIAAGVPGTPRAAGAYAPDVAVSVVAAFDGAGGYTVSVNGGAPVVDVGVPHPALAAVNIGSRPAGANSLNGEVARFAVRPL